ncbi:MAG: M13 family metallopeptidase [bacterium]
MKKHFYLLLILVATTTIGGVACDLHPSIKYKTGIHMDNLDSTASPKADFYQYACGGWMANNPIPDEESRYGTFDRLREENQSRLFKLVIKNNFFAKEEPQFGSDEQKIGDLFRIAMDSVRLNTEKDLPIKADLARIKKIRKVNEISTIMGEMTSVDMFFSIFVDADQKNASKNLLQTYQSGLGMGKRDFYFDEDETTSKIREEYKSHVEKMFILAGNSAKEAKNAADAVMNIETLIAKGHKTNVELRDPEGNYNKITIEELKQEYLGFDWDKYFTVQGINTTEISVSQPNAIKTAIEVINTSDLKSLKYYMQWHLIDAAAPYLSDDFINQNFEFYGKIMSGAQAQKPRWKNAVTSVDASLGMALGKLYCKEYFTAEAKKRMEVLVNNLIMAYSERLEQLEWMSFITRVKALDKLSSIYVKVGYPNTWRDYSDLTINSDDNYWQVIKNVSKFDHAEMIGKLELPVDKDEWLMTPQTVNAYYNPTTNEICFPAGILQYPFFDMKADDAFNYGAIGVVIAHEITHGFDDQGSQYDRNGNLSDWWTEEDKTNFIARTKVMEEFFNNIEVAPGLYANGAFTLGENIADHGGLQVAYQALQKAMVAHPLTTRLGLTPEQRFFIAYANIWAGNIRDAEIVNRTKTDPHSLGRWRVNGALPHIQAWYDAFDIKEGDPLYVAPEDRVSIW